MNFYTPEVSTQTAPVLGERDKNLEDTVKKGVDSYQ